jgi:hypothetical protein
MPHFRVDDGLHNHPKARKAGLEAMGLWNMSGSWCMGYLTDGFVPEWYVKGWPKGFALAKRLVDAGFWNPATKDGEKGWQFHEFVGPGRNDTREQILADREKWRKRKQGQRDSPQVSPRDNTRDTTEDNTRDTPRESYAESLHVTRDPTQPNPEENAFGYVPESASESNARDAAAATIGAELVGRTIPESIPSETRARLRVKANHLVKTGSSVHDVEEALVDWRTKTGVGAGILPSLVADVVKRRNGHTASPPGLTPGEAKVVGWAQLGSPKPAQEAIER